MSSDFFQINYYYIAHTYEKISPLSSCGEVAVLFHVVLTVWNSLNWSASQRVSRLYFAGLGDSERFIN